MRVPQWMKCVRTCTHSPHCVALLSPWFTQAEEEALARIESSPFVTLDDVLYMRSVAEARLRSLLRSPLADVVTRRKKPHTRASLWQLSPCSIYPILSAEVFFRVFSLYIGFIP